MPQKVSEELESSSRRVLRSSSAWWSALIWDGKRCSGALEVVGASRELREQHPSTGDFSTGVTGCTAVARFFWEESLHKAIERSRKCNVRCTAEGNRGKGAVKGTEIWGS